MKDRLFLNDQEVDLDENTLIALDKAIKDLQDISKSNANFSWTIKLPPTLNNKTVMENIQLTTSTSTIAYRRITAKIIKSGVEVVPNGYGILNKSNSSGYELQVCSGNYDFFQIISNRRLRELDLSTLNFTWDYSAVTSMRGNTTGVKFPLFNPGDLSNANRLVNAETQRPAIFINDVFLKIFEEAGATPEGDILANTQYLKTMLTILNDEKSGPYFDDTSGLIDFRDWDKNPPSVLPDPTKVKIAPGETWTFTYKLKYNIPVWSNVPLSTLKFYGFSGSIPIYTHVGTSGTFNVTFTDTFTNTGGVDIYITPVITATNLGTIKIQNGSIEGHRSGDLSPMFFIHVKPYSFGASSLGATASYGTDLIPTYNGSIIDVALALPDWSQKDFVNMVFNLFGILHDSDDYSPIIRLRQFQEIVDNKSIAIDMSDKYHGVKDPETEFRFKNYAQTNYFAYTQDDLDKNISSNLGRGSFTIDDQTLEKEKTILTLPAAASVMGKYLIGLDVPVTNRMDDTGLIIEKNIVPRLLIDATLPSLSGTPITYFDGVPNSATYTTNIPLCYFFISNMPDNLDWTSLLERHYKGLTKSLEYGRMLTEEFNLSAVDFANMDHFIPWYISQLSGYFYVPRIKQFTGKKLTKADLIKI